MPSPNCAERLCIVLSLSVVDTVTLPSNAKLWFPRSLELAGFVHQDAKVYLSTLNPGEAVNHKMLAGRHAWLQVLRGSVSVNGTLLETSDGLAVSDERSLTIVGERPAEVMLFDLA